MRKASIYIIVMIMAAVMLCGCQTEKNKDSDRLSIVTTIFAPYDFARELAGDKADVTMLLKPGAEAHTYEPTPQDIITIDNSDIFIYVGGENDAWVDDILTSIDTSNTRIIKLLDCVQVYEEELIEGMEEVEEEEEEGEEPEWDEHVWTSPVNAVTISQKLEETMAELDTDNAQVYKANLDAYVDKLNALNEEFKQVVENGQRQEFIFGDRFPLRYFAEEYGIKYYAAFPGCAADNEASPATIAFLINKVKEDKIPVIFKIELSNGNIADTIAEDTGAKVLTFYTCHNVSSDDFDAGETYLSLMERNVESLREALN